MCVTIVTSYLSLTIWCFNPYINPDAVIHQGPSKVWPTVQFLQLFETSTEIWHSGSELINPLIDLQRPVVKKCFIHSRVVRLRNWIANFSNNLEQNVRRVFNKSQRRKFQGREELRGKSMFVRKRRKVLPTQTIWTTLGTHLTRFDCSTTEKCNGQLFQKRL